MEDFDKPKIRIFKTKFPDGDFERQVNEFLGSDEVTGPIQVETSTLGDFYIITIIY